MPKPADNARVALPLYLQISEALTRDIASGRFVHGERLPPERSLAQRYGTTVRTLRKALKRLEENSLLERRHGSGNYVRQGPDPVGIYAMFRLERPSGAGLPSAQTLSVERLEKAASLPPFGTSHEASRVRRLRFLDAVPVALEEIWLDGDCGVLERETLSESLHFHYQNKLKFWIARAEDRVWAAPVPAWAPPEFGMPHGELVGYIERLSWAQRAEPVEFSRTWFNPQQARYVQRLG